MIEFFIATRKRGKGPTGLVEVCDGKIVAANPTSAIGNRPSHYKSVVFVLALRCFTCKEYKEFYGFRMKNNGKGTWRSRHCMSCEAEKQRKRYESI